MFKKCPLCGKEMKPDQKSCCGFMFEPNAKDKEGAKYKTKIECMRSRKTDPVDVFKKAKEKFEDGAWQVVGGRPDINDQSLLFGMMFYILLAKEKR